MTGVRVCSTEELPAAGQLLGVDVAGEPVCIARDATGNLHAVNDLCSHQSVKFSDEEDSVDGCQIECWLHAARFDLATGQPSGLPATEPIDVYTITVDGGDVFIDTTPTNQP